jgi:hypothetical protein
MEVRSDFRPGSTSIRISTVRGKPVPNELEVPIRARYRALIPRDACPKRLNVVDLLGDRQVVKARRRDGERLTHGSSVSEERSQASAETSEETSQTTRKYFKHPIEATRVGLGRPESA